MYNLYNMAFANDPRKVMCIDVNINSGTKNIEMWVVR